MVLGKPVKVLVALASICLLGAACGSTSPSPLTGPGAITSPAPDVSAATVVAAVKVALKGTGSRVPKVTLQAVTYIVSWAAKGGECFGSAGCSGENFFVDIVGADGQSDNIVAETTSDNIKVGSSGETTYTIGDAGLYLIKVKASNLTWTIVFSPV